MEVVTMKVVRPVDSPADRTSDCTSDCTSDRTADRPHVWRIGSLLLTAATLALCACSTVAERDVDRWLPRLGGEPAALAGESDAVLDQLARVSTSFAAALVQLPAIDPVTTTLQFSAPSSAFGNTLLRALEDAGYGIQRVEADQGSHYVAYRRRFAETDVGPVTDYEVSIGDLLLRREFVHAAGRVYPSSLLTVEGEYVLPRALELEDKVFSEQGGDVGSFISGIRSDAAGADRVGEHVVRDFDRVPQARQLSARQVLARVRARREFDESLPDALVEPSVFRLRRTVLSFDNDQTLHMRAGNKQAVRILASDTEPGDVFVMTACTDADGRNEAAESRGRRVVDEFLSHGIPRTQLRVAACVRASYRHPSDDSPVPLEVVQYRKRSIATAPLSARTAVEP